jgi:large subunit ribosomal protein L3
MSKGILGRKVGMTQIFEQDGRAIPVTVIEAGPCHVLQIKTVDRDGYEAMQLGFADKPRRLVGRAGRGHVASISSKRSSQAEGCWWFGPVRSQSVSQSDLFVSSAVLRLLKLVLRSRCVLDGVKSVDVTGTRRVGFLWLDEAAQLRWSASDSRREESSPTCWWYQCRYLPRVAFARARRVRGIMGWIA